MTVLLSLVVDDALYVHTMLEACCNYRCHLLLSCSSMLFLLRSSLSLLSSPCWFWKISGVVCAKPVPAFGSVFLCWFDSVLLVFCVHMYSNSSGRRKGDEIRQHRCFWFCFGSYWFCATTAIQAKETETNFANITSVFWFCFGSNWF